MHRVNVTFSDSEWRRVSKFCLKYRPQQREGTTLKEILLHGVTVCNAVLRDVPCPDSARVRNHVPDRAHEKGVINLPGKPESFFDANPEASWRDHPDFAHEVDLSTWKPPPPPPLPDEDEIEQIEADFAALKAKWQDPVSDE